MVAFALPKTGNVPIRHGKSSSPVGWATVDDSLVETINALGPWFLGDPRYVASPRIYVSGLARERKLLPLNRAVFTIVKVGKDGVAWTSKDELYALSKLVPARIDFEDRNPLNCCLANLKPGGSVASHILSARTIPSSVPSLVELPDSPPPSFDEMFSEGSRDEFGARPPELDNLRELLRKGNEDSSEVVKVTGETFSP